MICFPNAKINLGLSVLNKRKDGMHNIETCMIPVPLYDILEIRQSEDFSLIVEGADIKSPQSENLISKAWNLMQSLYNNIVPVEVNLYKNIPIGSGMGGGSSDAAFFIKLLNDYNSLGLSDHKMIELASQIGSDCSFFIKNEHVLAYGTGNINISMDNPVSQKHLTIVFPGINISTKEIFSKVVPMKSNPIIDIIKVDIANWRESLKNDFEEVVFDTHPILGVIKDDLYSKGAIYASLTGTGSGIYAISDLPLNIKSIKNRYKVWEFFMD